MAKENDSKFISLGTSPSGDIRIADEVIAVIAGYAVMEVEGIAAMAGNITGNILSKVGMKTLSKGVRVFIDDETREVRVDLAIIAKYGYAIPAICSAAQEKVKSTIETMTSLSAGDINIRIAGVAPAGSIAG